MHASLVKHVKVLAGEEVAEMFVAEFSNKSEPEQRAFIQGLELKMAKTRSNVNLDQIFLSNSTVLDEPIREGREG